MSKKILHLNLKSKYFNEIKNGTKHFEYRLCKSYWDKRLVDVDYDEVHFKLGYPKANDKDKIIVKPYLGYEVQIITHEQFNNKSVAVFAIRVSQ